MMKNTLLQMNRFFTQPTFFANGRKGGLVLLGLFPDGWNCRQAWYAARAFGKLALLFVFEKGGGSMKPEAPGVHPRRGLPRRKSLESLGLTCYNNIT